jgi:N-acetylneuraminic acid mutarotase
MYDPATDVWTRKADMPAAKENAGSVTVDGKIYCISGNSAATYMYDPANDTWTEKAGIPAGKSEFGCAAVDGKIYCIGGGDTACYMYDPGRAIKKNLPVLAAVNRTGERNSRQQ